MAIGRWILAHHAVPDISHFYYSTSAGFGYDYSWLSQVVLSGAYQWLGGAGVAIVNSAVAGFIFYLLYKMIERDNPNMLLNLIPLGFALVTTAAYLSGRPVMFTMAFLTLEVFILSGWVERMGERRGASDQPRGARRPAIGVRYSLWLIPLVTAIWTNLHPGFAVAPFVILVFLPMARQVRDRWALIVCFIASVAAVAINPYGWRMYSMPLEIARALPMLRGLSEWSGVADWETVVWGCFVAMVTWGLSLRRQPITVILLVTAAALASGVSNRNMPLFGVVAVFALGRTLLPALAPAAGRSGFLRKFDAKFEAAGGWFWAIAVPLALVGAVRLRVSPMNLDFDFSGYPAAAVRYVEAQGLPDNLFVRETWSSYLLWARPDRKLFFDAKGGFGPQAVTDHSALVKPKPDWRSVADRCGISTFLLERGSPLAVVLSETADWHREYSDSLSEVFVREPGDRAGH